MCARVRVQVRGAVKWAAAEDLQVELDRQVEAFLGPKTEADSQAPDKKKKKKVRNRLAAGIFRPKVQLACSLQDEGGKVHVGSRRA